jgi:hypothetical protein
MPTPDATDTYMALIDAIQNHIRVIEGPDYYARDWVLATGIDHIHDQAQHAGMIRMERSPRSTPYTITGLLGWALDCYRIDEDS